MKGEKIPRAVGYIRVSSGRQLEGYSLDAQRADIRRLCQQRGYDLLEIYSEDARSAHNERIEKRPTLTRLLSDARSRKFDIIIVHTIDRWARNLGVQKQALRVLADAEVGFISIKEDFDFTTPAGNLLLNMIGSVSEFFSDQLAVHVSKAHRQRVEAGLPVGPKPFAYRCDEPGGIPQVVPEAAEGVRMAFHQRAMGRSLGEIADDLNAHGHRTVKGRRFTDHAVKDLLTCKFYTGIFTYKGEDYPGKHEAIITPELFQQVQALRHRQHPRRTVHGEKGLFQGRISCLRCGNAVQADRHRFGDPMYRERHSFDCETNGRSVMARPIDAQMFDIISSLEIEPTWRDQIAELIRAGYDGPSLDSLQDQRRRLMRVYMNQGISDAEYRSRLMELDARIREAGAAAPPTVEEAAALFQDLSYVWEVAIPEERRRLIGPLIERVYVDMESKRIGALVPAAPFRLLLQCAVRKADAKVVLISQEETERLKVWSWWRRGRIELPVQRSSVLNLLQA